MKEKERGREEKSKSRDLSNRSLKTDGVGGVGGGREHRTYIGFSQKRGEDRRKRARAEI